jgi:sulfatase maturation enzyme AslB (radical SAM superfamily)
MKEYIKDRYSVSYITSLIQQLDEFNSRKLEDIELIENGKTLNIGPETLKEWSYIGMSNKVFIETRFWENKFDDSTLFS